MSKIITTTFLAFCLLLIAVGLYSFLNLYRNNWLRSCPTISLSKESAWDRYVEKFSFCQRLQRSSYTFLLLGLVYIFVYLTVVKYLIPKDFCFLTILFKPRNNLLVWLLLGLVLSLGIFVPAGFSPFSSSIAFSSKILLVIAPVFSACTLFSLSKQEHRDNPWWYLATILNGLVIISAFRVATFFSYATYHWLF